MKIIVSIIGFFLLLSETSFGQHIINIKTGSSVTRLETIEYKNDNLLFINLHSDEITSIKAVKQVLPKAFGKYIGILGGGIREVRFPYQGKTVAFDPNRIYTEAGIEKTLKNYNCFSDSNLKQTELFSKELLKYFLKAKLLVTLHNNGEGGFSIGSIMKEKDTKKDTEDIYINPDKDEDDFYYVTEKEKFDYFKSKGYNVVLQNNNDVEDDGSLSVYCGKNHISYINIECQTNHLKEQIQMIQEIYKAFFGLDLFVD
jgi:hypothetical protein